MKGVRGAVVAVALLASAACSGGPVIQGSAYRDPKLGWSIAVPPGGEARWTRIRVEGADLALRGPGGELMSVEVHCGVPLAAPDILARSLRSGIPDSVVHDQHEVMVDGRAGWAQVFDARLDRLSGPRPDRPKLDRPGKPRPDRPGGQSADAANTGDPQAVRVKTVTLVDARCVYDFVLAASGDWPAAEAAFDAWWGSFRAAPAAAGGGG